MRVESSINPPHPSEGQSVSADSVQAALRASEDRYRAFLSATTEVVFRLSPDWTELRQLHGREFVADANRPDRSWLETYIHPDDRPRVTEAIRRAIDTKGVFSLEHRVISVGGSVGWTHSRAVPILGDNGEIVEWFGTASDITERRRAAKEVADAREYAESIVETMHEPLLVLNADLTVRSVNPAFYEQFRVAPGQTIGRKIYDLGNGQWDIPALRTLLQDVLPDSHVFNDYVVSHRFEDIGERVMLLNARRLDSVQLILLGIRDITEQKRADADLRQNEERLSLAVEVGELASWDWEVRTGEVRWNDRHYLQQGYAVGEVTPSFEAWISRVHPDDREEAIAHINRARDERSRYAHDFRTLHPDGQVRWISARGRFFYDHHGQAVRMIGVMLDVTERKRTEAALRESEAKYRTLFQQIDEGFCIIEVIFEGERPVDYRFIEVNPAFERQTGIVDAEGRRMREIAPAHEEHWFEYYGDIARTGVARRFEAPANALDGRWYDVNAFRVGEPGQHRVAILFNDITQRRRAAMALHQSEERLRLATEAAGMGSFAWYPDEDRTEADAKFLALFGQAADDSLTRAELMTRTVHPDDRDRHEIVVRRALDPAGDGIFREEIRVVHSDGAERWIAIHGRTEFGGEPRKPLRLFGVAFDITARKRADEHQAFLLRLSDALRPISDPVAVQAEACRVLGTYLGVDRAYYVEIDESRGECRVRRDYLRGTSPSMAGVYRLVDYGWSLPIMRANQTIVFADVARTDLVPPAFQPALIAIQIVAHIAVPILKDGALVGCFCVTEPFPREWTPAEVSLVEETAQRTWTAVDQAKVERALRESEGRLRAVAANLPGGAVFVINSDLRYELAEGQGLRDAGLSSSDYEGKTLAEALSPELADASEANCRRALAGESFLTEHAGGTRQFVTRGVPLRDAAGQVTAVLAVSYDITDRVRAEEGTRRAEQRLQLALKAAQMGTWSWRVSTDLHRRDANLNRLLGQDPVDVEVPIERFFDHIHPDDRDSVRVAIDNAVRRGHNMKVDFRVIWPDGQVRWLSDQGDVFGAGDDRYLAGACVDITDRKRLEEELRDADRRKDEFLAMLAHELRNPMAPIRAATEILKRPEVGPDKARCAVAMIDRQVLHMVRLVDDLLDVSRVSRGKIELMRTPIDLLSVIQPAVEIAQPLCDSFDHDLSITLPSRPLYVNGDPTRLTQVIGNLLNNACKFTERSGRIWLIVERDGDHAAIRVRDNGIGIAADQLAGIFELFTQVDTSRGRSRGGLGLGLTLVKNLVEMHDGTIEVHSAGIGQGSEFVIRLPLIPSPTTKPAPPATPASPPESPVAQPDPVIQSASVDPPANPSTRRILVVDDNPEIARGLEVLLEISGHEVHTASDGLAAVEAAERVQPDVVLLDLGLPGIDGYEAARRIRAQRRDKPLLLVALSGWARGEDRQLSQEAGFDAHLVKPPDVDALMKLLDESAGR